MSSPRLMVFDLSGDLHLPEYLHCLVEAWAEREIQGELALVVHPAFAERHADLVGLAERAPRGDARWLTLSGAEQGRRRERQRARAGAESSPVLVRPGVAAGDATAAALAYDWELLHRYAKKVGATQVVVVAVDAYLPLLAGGFAPPCPLSGIVFAPMFHYGRPGSPPRSQSNRAMELRQTFLLARVLRHERVHRLFMLDPFAVAEASRFVGGEKVVLLQDPVSANGATEADVTALRARLGVSPGRSILLMFGHLSPRKGCAQALDAVMALPDAACRSIAIVLAGVAHAEYRAELERRAAALRAARPVEVVCRFEYVPSPSVAAYFRMADVVLVPYPRHAGMSGVLLRAAAAGTPVLSSSYGLMGEFVRRHRLGVTVDASDPEAIAAGVRRLLGGVGADLVDAVEMRRVAGQHEARRFGATVLDALLGDRSPSGLA